MLSTEVNSSTVLNSTIINYDNLSGKGFKQITFKTHDPVTNIEKQLDECYTPNTRNSGKSFVILVSKDACNIDGVLDDEDHDPYKSLSTGVISGMVVGTAVFVAAVAAFFSIKFMYQSHKKLLTN